MLILDYAVIFLKSVITLNFFFFRFMMSFFLKVTQYTKF